MSEKWTLSDPQVKPVPAFKALVAAAELTIPKIPIFAEQATTDLMRTADAHAIDLADAPVFVYTGAGVGANDTFLLRVCLPVSAETEFAGTETIQLLEVEGFTCAAFDYTGPMTHLGEAYPHAMNALKDAGHTPIEESREVYKHWVEYDAPDNVVEIQLGITPG